MSLRDFDLNLLRILAGPTRDPGGPADPGDASRLVEEALAHRDEVARLAGAHLSRARELLARTDDVDARTVLATAARIIDVYTAGTDPFFR